MKNSTTFGVLPIGALFIKRKSTWRKVAPVDSGRPVGSVGCAKCGTPPDQLWNAEPVGQQDNHRRYVHFCPSTVVERVVEN